MTAVPNVYLDFGGPNQRPLEGVRAYELKNYKRYGFFKAGSMLPKVEAVIAFSERRKGNVGIITDIEHLRDALIGKAGTIVTE